MFVVVCTQFNHSLRKNILIFFLKDDVMQLFLSFGKKLRKSVKTVFILVDSVYFHTSNCYFMVLWSFLHLIAKFNQILSRHTDSVRRTKIDVNQIQFGFWRPFWIYESHCDRASDWAILQHHHLRRSFRVKFRASNTHRNIYPKSTL